MWRKPYGKTGKDISVIACGGMRFATPDQIDDMAQVVLHAHRKGINYFDTAPFYCNDKSEDIMGAAFKQMPRDSFYCASKCGSAKGDEMRQSIERSLKRLNVDCIDFFHVWCLVWPHQLQERIDGGAIGALLKAKEEGLVRHVVVSTHLSGPDIATVLDSGLFEGMTIGYNALNFPFRAGGLAAARKHSAGVVTMNPLGGGIIPRNAERLAFLKGPNDRDVIQAALRFNISQPEITAALVGFSSIAEVDQAVDAVENFQPYPADHIDRLKAHIATSFDGFCTGCGYCLPCPSGLQIPPLHGRLQPEDPRRQRPGHRQPPPLALGPEPRQSLRLLRMRPMRRPLHPAPPHSRPHETCGRGGQRDEVASPPSPWPPTSNAGAVITKIHAGSRGGGTTLCAVILGSYDGGRRMSEGGKRWMSPFLHPCHHSRRVRVRNENLRQVPFRNGFPSPIKEISPHSRPLPAHSVTIFPLQTAIVTIILNA